jgi:glycosyltransferase involved in cell wall biosynthesis
VPLRVLTVVPYFFPAWAYGGIPRLAYGLSRALQQRGHQVRVITTDALDQTDRLPYGEANVEGLHVFRFRNLSNRLAYEHQLFLPLGARNVLRKSVAEADVVHLHGYWHLLNNAAVSAARELNRPVVLTPNGTLLPHERKTRIKAAWHQLFGKAVLEGVDRFIAVSRAELNQFHRAGLDPDRVDMVHNGLELAEFETLPERGTFRRAHGIGERPVVLYLGKLTPRKGVHHLVGAMARLRDLDPVLVIAGNDMAGVRDGLEELARGLDLTRSVRFVGLLTGPERLAALSDADVLVYPSTEEIFGLVPFEGMMCGTPAVVTDDCGCGELVAQARAGVLVRYGDEAMLAASLRSLLADPIRRKRMVARGRKFIEKHFAWGTIAAQTEAVYRKAQRRRDG